MDSSLLPSSSRSPHEPRVIIIMEEEEEGPGSDHCSDSGGTSRSDVETRESDDDGSNGNGK